MDVRVESSTIIHHQNPSAEPVEVPLTVFDLYVPRCHVSVLFLFKPPTPVNSAVINGLAKTLVHFPTLAGKLGRSRGENRPCVLVGGGEGCGALVVEATVASELAEHLPMEPRPELQRLHPPWRDVEGPISVLQVQLNRFACGGLVVGVTTDHRVADGKSMSSFFIAWGQLIRGVPISPLPVLDKSWLKPRSPPRCEFNHLGTDFVPSSPDHGYHFPVTIARTDPSNISNLLLHYSDEFIATKLRPQVKEKRSRFEILLAHVWRKITIARGLDRTTSTVVNISVNGRPRLRPPVPTEFFGNLVLTARPELNAEALVNNGIAAAATLIHEAIARVGDDYFKSVIDFGALHDGEELVGVAADLYTNVMFPHLEVDSLLGFRFQEVDFGGGGELCGFLLSWEPIDGLLLFWPSLREDGGVDVFVGLLKEHAQVLKNISHSLD